MLNCLRSRAPRVRFARSVATLPFFTEAWTRHGQQTWYSVSHLHRPRVARTPSALHVYIHTHTLVISTNGTRTELELSASADSCSCCQYAQLKDASHSYRNISYTTARVWSGIKILQILLHTGCSNKIDFEWYRTRHYNLSGKM